jgi:DNA gyrase/topoisomerase IV subunit B
MGERQFDLNIGKILDGWEPRHAIRESIANALDEQVLSGTEEIRIGRDAGGDYHIRDYGRGIRYDHAS